MNDDVSPRWRLSGAENSADNMGGGFPILSPAPCNIRTCGSGVLAEFLAIRKRPSRGHAALNDSVSIRM